MKVGVNRSREERNPRSKIGNGAKVRTPLPYDATATAFFFLKLLFPSGV